jgi:hypothetical protein
MMSTIYNPDPTTASIPPASGVAQASAKTASSMSRGYPLRRAIGGALSALALMVGALAVVASVAAPTASAMKNCGMYMRAANYQYGRGHIAEGDMQLDIFNYCLEH